MSAKFAPLGSVSSNTMRPEDLVTEFLYMLGQLDKARHDEVVADYEATLNGDDPEEDDNMAELCDDLFTVLGEYAPPLCYFGANEGDGADYGFWVLWESVEDGARDGSILRIPAGDEWPSPLPDGTDYVLEVTDHGNGTLFGVDGKELWSVV